MTTSGGGTHPPNKTSMTSMATSGNIQTPIVPRENTDGKTTASPGQIPLPSGTHPPNLTSHPKENPYSESIGTHPPSITAVSEETTHKR
ncbi:unnamed protein product [Danaus chrysippus]|uniref:(African queen) hypothetical protein n=1 Tax=Danaus chrysippus TaxID=151541 RepID=A0A8J2VQS5_9NEOP|nr:unnamed protein product [Danaus chrysippus]